LFKKTFLAKGVIWELQLKFLSTLFRHMGGWRYSSINS